jgi:5-hydroxyisourate hydrolase
MSTKSPITTHVLDISAGQPAAGIEVQLERRHETGRWQKLGEGATDPDGRIADLLPPGSLLAGHYRLVFATGDYFKRKNTATFYPTVVVEFQIIIPDQHYHVPLLLSPFGYSTYRGS